MPKPRQSFFVRRIQIKKKKKCRKRVFLRKKGCDGLNKKRKRKLFNGSLYGEKKDPTTSIRKLDNELKVHKKTVRTTIKPKP